MTTSAYPGYIYVGSPYTHALDSVRQERYEAVRRYTAYLHSVVLASFSPIVHGHNLHGLIYHPDKNSHEYWMAMDLPMLDAAREMHVLCLPGWQQSRGLRDEISRAVTLRKPVRWITTCARAVGNGAPIVTYENSGVAP